MGSRDPLYLSVLRLLTRLRRRRIGAPRDVPHGRLTLRQRALLLGRRLLVLHLAHPASLAEDERGHYLVPVLVRRVEQHEHNVEPGGGRGVVPRLSGSGYMVWRVLG